MSEQQGRFWITRFPVLPFLIEVWDNEYWPEVIDQYGDTRPAMRQRVRVFYSKRAARQWIAGIGDNDE